MKKSALLTVFLVVLVDLIGFGIVLPLIPFYASQFDATPLDIGLLYSIYSLAQLVFSPIWGGFSDRVGRRPVMLVSTVGACLAYTLFALSNSLWMLFLSRLVAGIMGGNISTAQAYVADVTTHEERARGMGLIGAAFGIGFMAGPALAAFLIHPGVGTFLGNKYALPGFFAALLSFFSFLLVIFKLPETVQKNKMAVDEERIARPSIFSAAFWGALKEEGRNSSKHLLPLFMLCMFVLAFGQSSLYSAFPLFCKTQHGLDPQKVGLQFAAMGLIAVAVQGGLIRPLEKRFGERKLFLVGSALMVGGMTLIPFAATPLVLMFYLAILAIGASLNGPTLNSLISKQADPHRIGYTMGSSQGFSALGRVVGPAWGGLLFGVSFKWPFVITALVVSYTLFVGLKLQE